MGSSGGDGFGARIPGFADRIPIALAALIALVFIAGLAAVAGWLALVMKAPPERMGPLAAVYSTPPACRICGVVEEVREVARPSAATERRPVREHRRPHRSARRRAGPPGGVAPHLRDRGAPGGWQRAGPARCPDPALEARRPREGHPRPGGGDARAAGCDARAHRAGRRQCGLLSGRSRKTTPESKVA